MQNFAWNFTQLLVNKKLSCRKETVRLLCGTVLANITGRRYFADIISLSFNPVTWWAWIGRKKTQNKGYYAAQGHLRSPISVPIKSPYATLVINTTNILSCTVLKLSQIIVRARASERANERTNEWTVSGNSLYTYWEKLMYLHLWTVRHQRVCAVFVAL